MEALSKLDNTVTQIVLALHQSAPNDSWTRQAYRVAMPADGSFRSEVYAYWSNDKRLSDGFPTEPGEAQIGRLAMAHCRQTVETGLPRWYTMTVRVERTGKFTVYFEYLDTYPKREFIALCPNRNGWLDPAGALSRPALVRGRPSPGPQRARSS